MAPDRDENLGPSRCFALGRCDTFPVRKDRGSRMATPTRPCPYCGAAVLMNAPACGTCGRPMPPMQAGAPPGGPAPAKTMFGYAAPQLPKQGQQGGAAGGAPGGAPGQGFKPPQQQGFQPPQQQGFGQPGQPQAKTVFGQAAPQVPQAQQPQPQ